MLAKDGSVEVKAPGAAVAVSKAGVDVKTSAGTAVEVKKSGTTYSTHSMHCKMAVIVGKRLGNNDNYISNCICQATKLYKDAQSCLS